MNTTASKKRTNNKRDFFIENLCIKLSKDLVRFIFEYTSQTKRAFSRVVLSTLLLLPNFLPNNLIDPFSYDYTTNPNKHFLPNTDSEFDIKIAKRFTSVSSIVYFVKRHTKANDQLSQIELVNRIAQKRFHHAYAVYGMQENWMAVLLGRFVWRDLAAKVIPDDILKEEVASCSQVSLVLMDCYSQLGIPTRKIGLNGHFVMEAKAYGKWYYLDANMKPNFSAIGGRKSLSVIVKNNELVTLYKNTDLGTNSLKDKFSSIRYYKPNIAHAPRAYLFHKITSFLSTFLWLLPLLMFFKK